MSGILALPASIVIGTEDGPMPADQLGRKMALAKAVLLMGGGVAVLAACGLDAVSRADPHRIVFGPAGVKPPVPNNSPD
jgi:hypothetical protein